VSDFEAVVRWYLVLALMAGVGLPLGTIILGDSRRYAAWFSRPLGMLAVFFPTWFLSSAVNLPYTTVGLYITLVLVGASAWFYVYRARLYDIADWPVLAAAEITTLLTFLGALWLRGYTPNILNTEKPMDAAFLASSIRTDIMPPPDPWMSGESINYYYIGYALHGAIARMAGVAVGQAYNLALITTTAIIVAAVVGAAAVALPKWAKIAAPIAVFFIVIAGNMVAPVRYLEDGRSVWDQNFYGLGWEASRVVHDGTVETINEFPAFTIILGDLHPHLTAFPFTILVLAFAIVIARQKFAISYPQLVAAGILGGALYGMNTWDLPTYFGLILLAIIWNLRSQGRQQILLRGGVAIVSALVAWAPFILDFTPPGGADPNSVPSFVRNIPGLRTLYETVGGNGFDFTSAGEFLKVFGLPYFMICLALIIAARELPGSITNSRLLRQVAILASIFIVIALLAGVPVLVFVAIPGSVAVWTLYRKSIDSTEGLISALFIAGSLLVVLCEFFYIHDVYTSRMNTLFKAYFQVWMLWGFGAALALCYVLTSATGRSEVRIRQSIFAVVTCAALILGILYPATTVRSWVDFYNPAHTWEGLDGLAYVGTMNPDERAGIQFIADNANDDSVVLEAPGCAYQPISQIPFDHVSAFTGVPTVRGWGGHERLWRGGDDTWLEELDQRTKQVQGFNPNPKDPSQWVPGFYENPTQQFVDQYDIDFVYYGIYEAGQGYPTCKGYDTAPELPKPTDAQMSAIGFTQVFQQGDVTIWQRTS
jgi:YYY domain-containing protein